MTAASPPDVLSLPLEGTVAIEASAGTGKTYTITALYLRLLLEVGLPVERILVVTFTVGATQELRHRIRERLQVAAERLAAPPSEDRGNDLLGRLLARVDADVARRRVQRALVCLDQAAIFTIHGFCQRALSDQAFESGQPFRAELVPDARALLQEAVDDAWRRATHTASPLWADWLCRCLPDPEALADGLQPYVARADLHVVAPDAPDAAALEASEQRCLATWETLRALERTELAGAAALLGSPAFNAARVRNVGARMQQLAALRLAALPPLDRTSRELFARLGTSHLASCTRARARMPSHRLFDVCDTLARDLSALDDAFARRAAALRGTLLHALPAMLDARKRRQQVQTFDDLLSRLAGALTDATRGPALVEAMRARFAAALVDEFQDTDPLQYDIVRRVWGDGGAPLVFVGDPKQAIYSFRGADVFAYLRARAHAHRVHRLLDDHRADPLLVAAVNAVFAHAPQPFVVEDIPFVPAAPADPARPPGLHIAGAPAPPFEVWSVPADAGNKADVRAAIAAATAGEVVRLLTDAASGGCRVRAPQENGGREMRPLRGSDIAVLVQKNDEARLIRDALLAVGVPSVLQTQDSVLATREADELRLVLMAVAEPGREDVVRAALATELLGADGAALESLGRDDARWTERLGTFRDYAATWRVHGAARMLSTLVAAERVPERLLTYADGERRLTNVLHGCELIAGEAVRRGLGPEGVVAWMLLRRDAELLEDDESLLRLESDEHLVRVVTVHKSKGLEYPVVFCPFLWDGWLRALAGKRDVGTLFHDPAAARRLTLDLHPKPDRAHVELQCREELAERLRLVYVALTRARHRCVVAWGALPGAGTSGLRWLLHPPADASIPLADIGKAFEGADDATIRGALDALVARAPAGAIVVRPMPPAPHGRAPLDDRPGAPLAARPFIGRVPAGWRMASFTSLAAHRDADAPDRDAVATSVGEEATPSASAPRDPHDLFDFPGGIRAGRCVHELFERVDFTAATPAVVDALARERLAAHGLSLDWAPALARMVARVLATPLDPHGRVRLDAVGPAARVSELEFTYPLAQLDTHTVQRLVGMHGMAGGAFATSIGRLQLQPTRGYMRGFIDLVFVADGRYWLLDWKSNRLGPTAGHYRGPQLTDVMAREAYWLQYLVYTVALHRHLARRLPGYDYDRHVGGVFYVFVRAVDPAAGHDVGIFHDRPPAALVHALDAHLRGEDV